MSGAVHTTDAEKADELNSYFTSINTADSNVMSDFAFCRKDSNKLEDVHFTPNILVKICKKIHPKLTMGPSHITQEQYIGSCYATLRVISVFYVTG